MYFPLRLVRGFCELQVLNLIPSYENTGTLQLWLAISLCEYLATV